MRQLNGKVFLSNPVTIVWMTLLLLEINSYSEAQEKYNVSS